MDAKNIKRRLQNEINYAAGKRDEMRGPRLNRRKCATEENLTDEEYRERNPTQATSKLLSTVATMRKNPVESSEVEIIEAPLIFRVNSDPFEHGRELDRTMDNMRYVQEGNYIRKVECSGSTTKDRSNQ